jgi:tetratricopeptide (TPR) repeat protein
MLLRYFTVGIFLLVFLAGCSSGKQSFEKGDYDRAVYKAVNRLQKDPNNSKALQTLKQAYGFAKEEHLNRIKESTASNDLFRWERVISEYEALNNLADALRRCPSCRQAIGTDEKYLGQLTEATNKAAEVRYSHGLKLLAENNRLSAKEAYASFERADQLLPGYKDTHQKLEEAYRAAVLKVVVEPVEVNKGVYQLSNEYFQNKIYEYLQHYERKSFIKFYTQQEASREKFVPDQVLSLNFDDFVVGQTYVKEKEQEIQRDSVKTGTVDGKDVYGTVKAKLITFEKTITSSGLLDFRVTDWKTKNIITQEKMPGTFVWRDEWATYKGDERALTKEHKKKVNHRESPNPNPQFLFVEFTKPIYGQLTSKIESFYRKY